MPGRVGCGRRSIGDQILCVGTWLYQVSAANLPWFALCLKVGQSDDCQWKSDKGKRLNSLYENFSATNANFFSVLSSWHGWWLKLEKRLVKIVYSFCAEKG